LPAHGHGMDQGSDFIEFTHKSLGSHLPEILGNSGIVHRCTNHDTWDLCHVTQPGVRINVSCSRANDRGLGGPQKGGLQRTAKDSEGWVPGKRTRTEEGTGRERDSTAPLTQHLASGAWKQPSWISAATTGLSQCIFTDLFTNTP
jgi:hypothetical protein